MTTSHETATFEERLATTDKHVESRLACPHLAQSVYTVSHCKHMSGLFPLGLGSRLRCEYVVVEWVCVDPTTRFTFNRQQNSESNNSSNCIQHVVWMFAGCFSQCRSVIDHTPRFGANMSDTKMSQRRKIVRLTVAAMAERRRSLKPRSLSIRYQTRSEKTLEIDVFRSRRVSRHWNHGGTVPDWTPNAVAQINGHNSLGLIRLSSGRACMVSTCCWSSFSAVSMSSLALMIDSVKKASSNVILAEWSRLEAAAFVSESISF